MTTGYDDARAVPHELRLTQVFALLHERGYQPTCPGPNGDQPDIKIRDRDGRTAWVDVKTPQKHHDRLAIKHLAFIEYERLTLARSPVYIIWCHQDDRMTVHTTHTLMRRIWRGPNRPNGNGSNTDYLVFEYQDDDGTPFDTFFPSA